MAKSIDAMRKLRAKGGSSGPSRMEETLSEVRRMGYEPMERVKVPDLRGRANEAYEKLSAWAYDSGKGDPGVGRISAKTREQMLAKERAAYAKRANASRSGRWHEDATRGITREEAERRNDEEWRREKRRHARVMRYLGAS
ncbi:MAG: hypothetical protein HFJ75_07695 [Eggerthellaceae bacterium]|nr:hypothetical protein [Eggerthellaceae bacterium]